jgi:hypothetical protein
MASKEHEEFLDFVEETVVRNKVLDHYHKLITQCPIKKWPRELRVLAVTLTGNFKVCNKGVNNS